MEPGRKQNIKTYFVKNLVSNSGLLLLKEKLESSGFYVEEMNPGRITLQVSTKPEEEKLLDILKRYGLEIIQNREKQLVEQIKIAIIELVHHMNNVDSIVRKSEYLVGKLGLSYPYLSKIFSSHEPVTLEKYMILQKIERIKELIDSDEYTLSEIAYMMDYSSVQYLSNQFRLITGASVTDYKKSHGALKKLIDDLY